MKLISPFAVLASALQLASAHYIWTTLKTGSTQSTAAVRQPLNNTPVEAVSSGAMVCNNSPRPATQTVDVPSGSTVGFRLDNTMYHQGPAAIYLGQVPAGQTAATWNGSGANWFKIDEWGATFNPFQFTTYNKNSISTTIPSNTPPGEYLLRVEQIGLHVAGKPQFYISCAQIRITGGGSGRPPKVSIPGYVSAGDPGLSVNIYNPIPTSYTYVGQAWSPNTWKVRYALNYKRIAYRTQWVEFPDIEPLHKANNIPPTQLRSGGSELYTLPAIFDPSTQIYLADSASIVKYLDTQYPDTPKLFPSGTKALQTAFLSAFVPKINPIILPHVTKNLNPSSASYFKSARERTFGTSMEELLSDSKGRIENWNRFRGGMGDIDRWMGKNDDVDGPFIMGLTPVFSDFVVGGLLAWIRNVWGEDSSEWVEIKGWHGGRWARFAESLKQYEELK